MIKLNSKIELTLHIINILVLLSLCIAIYINGQGLSCDKCEIKFSYQQAYGEETKELQISIMDLYEPFNRDGSCYVWFDRTGGFRVNEDVK